MKEKHIYAINYLIRASYTLHPQLSFSERLKLIKWKAGYMVKPDRIKQVECQKHGIQKTIGNKCLKCYVNDYQKVHSNNHKRN